MTKFISKATQDLTPTIQTVEAVRTYVMFIINVV